MYSTFSLPTSFLIWRIASRKGNPSMSPTVPPTSTTMTSAIDSSARAMILSLISLVTWGTA